MENMTTPTVAPNRGVTWRPLTTNEELADLTADAKETEDDFLTHPDRPRVLVHGTHRCGALGLAGGDCNMQRRPDSHYCYYHSKLQDGAITSCMVPYRDGGGWSERAPSNLYPVYPLPASGYALLSSEVAA